MLVFDCFAKYGNRWSYKGTVRAENSHRAARHMAYVHDRKVWGIRPSDCPAVKLFVYRFQYIPSLAGA